MLARRVPQDLAFGVALEMARSMDVLTYQAMPLG
jgi:hypothetical protein